MTGTSAEPQDSPAEMPVREQQPACMSGLSEAAPLPAEAAAPEKIHRLMKLYGVLCLVQGSLEVLLTLAAVAFIALTNVLDQAEFIPGLSGIADLSTMSVILLAAQLVLSVVTSALLIVFGVSILKNRRRHAAHVSAVLCVLIIGNIILSLMIDGLNAVNLIVNLVTLVILIDISVTVDPTLSDERQLQRTLRNMELKQDVEEGTLGRDESGRGYVKLDFFNLFWTFAVCCVLGLLVELAYHMIVVEPGVYQDRAGLLWGPFSPIYGFGAVLMTVALNRFWRANPLLIFLVSAVIGGAFEYFVSWFMQIAFGITAWDYTGTFLSIGGRTNFQFMCMWGVLGVVWIKCCMPLMLKLINLIPWRWRYAITGVAAVLMLVDGLATLQSLDCWYERCAGQVPTTPIERLYAEYFDNDYMAHRFQTMTINPNEAARGSEAGA